MGIQALNISKSFGDFVALDNISIDVRSGRLTALLGPSGGGKSTLLRVIAGLDQADSGTVRIEGADATGLPPQRRDVGFVYAHGRVLKKVSSEVLIEELFHEIDRWIEAGMPRPKRLKLAKPAALMMAEAAQRPS